MVKHTLFYCGTFIGYLGNHNSFETDNVFGSSQGNSFNKYEPILPMNLQILKENNNLVLN